MRKKSQTAPVYAVEQAIFNPRDGTYSFRHWGQYETLKEAEREAKRIRPARVLEVWYVSQF
jgi:hypothetical protein